MSPDLNYITKKRKPRAKGRLGQNKHGLKGRKAERNKKKVRAQ